jgi:hypothetical protein
MKLILSTVATPNSKSGHDQSAALCEGVFEYSQLRDIPALAEHYAGMNQRLRKLDLFITYKRDSTNSNNNRPFFS